LTLQPVTKIHAEDEGEVIRIKGVYKMTSPKEEEEEEEEVDRMRHK
jgi:hypothetical protein